MQFTVNLAKVGRMKIAGILFDKDGTLFDFRATWDVWAGRLLTHLSAGNAALETQLAQVIGYDLHRPGFLSDSPIIAGTNRQAAVLLAAELPGQDVDALELYLAQSAAEAPLAPVLPLAPFIDSLVARDLRLGVMTNDSEQSAIAHLRAAGIADRLQFIAGADSGYGAKPDPDPLLAFATLMQLPPEQVVMVGDSTHDLLAGRRAGMITIGVLTGLAERQELATLADVILPDIGHIPAWLETLT